MKKHAHQVGIVTSPKFFKSKKNETNHLIYVNKYIYILYIIYKLVNKKSVNMCQVKKNGMFKNSNLPIFPGGQKDQGFGVETTGTDMDMAQGS